MKQKQGGKAEDIQEAFLEWFRNARLKLNKILISWGNLHYKAEQLGQIILIENFNITDGWLTRLKERNNIVYCKLHGERQNADFDVADNLMITILPIFLKDYDFTQIFNSDETGLFYQALPEHTPMFKTVQ